MTNTIAELWNGNIKPIKNMSKHNEEIENIEKLISNNRQNLDKTLNDSQKELFQRYIDCINEYVGLVTEQSFCEGYVIATKLTAEALTDASQLL